MTEYIKVVGISMIFRNVFTSVRKHKIISTQKLNFVFIKLDQPLRMIDLILVLQVRFDEADKNDEQNYGSYNHITGSQRPEKIKRCDQSNDATEPQPGEC